jgi:glucose/arabinose dehydrogenase
VHALKRSPIFAVFAALGASLMLLAGCGSDPGNTDVKAPTVETPKPPDEAPPEDLPTGSGAGGVKLTKVGDFDEPVYVTQPPGNDRDLFVVERKGRIRVVRDGKPLPVPFLDISGEVATGFNEQGLLSMAFPPDYESSGLFYVYYTDTNGDIKIAEYRRADSEQPLADPESRRELLGIEHSANDNHNGGLLLFGPDGALYAGTGDGGGAGDPERNAQDLSSLLGKILRIDPAARGGKPYGIPEDNPFLGRSGARPEIFEYGLRNPWRFSFDPFNDALLIGDVGQENLEEVDYLPRGKQAGANLGWSAFEGTARYNDDVKAPGAVAPIFTYGREGGCSITGGFVVADPELPTLYRRYLYGDFCAGQLRSLVPGLPKARDDRELGVPVPGLSSFGVDVAGHVYATSLSGPVFRLSPQ